MSDEDYSNNLERINTIDLIELEKTIKAYIENIDNLSDTSGQYVTFIINELTNYDWNSMPYISTYNLFIKHNINPKISITKEKIIKQIDENMLKRIFENIISNEIKYSDEFIEIKLTKSGKIIFRNQTKKLDKTTVEKIFDRYYTVENAKKSTGIGLSIAKQLVELNNGIISANYDNGYLTIEIIFK